LKGRKHAGLGADGSRALATKLGDFLFFDQPQVAADVQPEVAREKACYALDI
jgi:hypothetical protein